MVEPKVELKNVKIQKGSDGKTYTVNVLINDLNCFSTMNTLFGEMFNDPIVPLSNNENILMNIKQLEDYVNSIGISISDYIREKVKRYMIEKTKQEMTNKMKRIHNKNQRLFQMRDDKKE